MTAMDFCNSFLKPHIKCSSPCADNYDVDNLISSDVCERQRGFVTESYIRPPVVVDVKFCAPVDIKQISFQTKVMSKHSIGFIVLVSHQSSDNSGSSDDAFELVCKVFTDNEENVLLSNPHYHNSQLHSRALVTQPVGPSTCSRSLRCPSHDALQGVRRVRLRILKTVSNTGCALRTLQVWGRVGGWATHLEKKEAELGWQKYSSQILNNNNDPLQTKTECNKQQQHNAAATSDDTAVSSVPEQFLDAITCEVMVTPMLLPSGHSVDATTLDKFARAESCYNRPPSDPFTFVQFTATVHPTPNVYLKARIDRFLTFNSQDPELNDVGRSLLPVLPMPGPPPPQAPPPPPQAPLQAPPPPPEALHHVQSSAAACSSIGVANGPNNVNEYKHKKRKLEVNSTVCDISATKDVSFASRFKSVNGDGLLNNKPPSIASSLTEGSGIHRGLPQIVQSRCKRPIAKSSQKSFLRSKPSRDLDDSPCTGAGIAGTSGTTTAHLDTNCNTIVTRSLGNPVPLSRSLLHRKPPKVIHGDGLHLKHAEYSSEAILRRCNSDCCSKCKDTEQLYVLETCSHLICGACLRQTSAGPCSDGAETVAVGDVQKGTTPAVDASLAPVHCGLCNVPVQKKHVRRHHSKSVFSR